MTIGAWLMIGIAIFSAFVIAAHESRRPQRMAVMNVVWPLTALYFSVFALLAYFTWGQHKEHGRAVSTAIGTSHCGAGCALADILTELTLAFSGFTLWHSMLFTSFLFDFIAAWAVGVAFQYFSLKPMRPELTRAKALVAAIKADTLSILAFQVGMYIVMAVTHHHTHLAATDPRYWVLMQPAMIAGFLTAYPMNAWLIRMGIKEAM